MTKQAFIAQYVRSPFGFAKKGPFAEVRPEDLGAHVIRALLQRTGISGDEIEDVVWGCAFPEGEQGLNSCAPGIMGIGPAEASRKALLRAGLAIDEIEIIEMNEAFAAQSEACRRELNIPKEKLNIDGGAIALGHPLGATGGRLVGKAATLLKREKGKYALSTQCIGGGMGIAMTLEAA